MSKEIKEAIDLLNKIDTVIIHGMQSKDSLPHQAVMKIGELRGRTISILRRFLEQPKCKTCGDTGKTLYKSKWSIGGLSCPDCQRPSAGVFTKECRTRINAEIKRIQGCIKRDEQYPNQNIVDISLQAFRSEKSWLEKYIILCDRLDSAEAINADLLAACIALNSCFDKSFFTSGVVDLPQIDRARKMAEAAIAKAKK